MAISPGSVLVGGSRVRGSFHVEDMKREEGVRVGVKCSGSQQWTVDT